MWPLWQRANLMNYQLCPFHNFLRTWSIVAKLMTACIILILVTQCPRTAIGVPTSNENELAQEERLEGPRLAPVAASKAANLPLNSERGMLQTAGAVDALLSSDRVSSLPVFDSKAVFESSPSSVLDPAAQDAVTSSDELGLLIESPMDMNAEPDHVFVSDTRQNRQDIQVQSGKTTLNQISDNDNNAGGLFVSVNHKRKAPSMLPLKASAVTAEKKRTPPVVEFDRSYRGVPDGVTPVTNEPLTGNHERPTSQKNVRAMNSLARQSDDHTDIFGDKKPANAIHTSLANQGRATTVPARTPQKQGTDSDTDESDALTALIEGGDRRRVSKDAENIPVAESFAVMKPEDRLPVPNIVTFIFGLKGAEPPFRLENYLSVKSAFEYIKPKRIYFYYHWEPVGKWWKMAKPYLTLKRIELPTKVYGNPVDHYAHKADVIRLQAMIQHGGIYMDMDVVALKSFDPLRKYDFVMGEEGEDGSVGLCNAIMVSRPNSTFARRWLASYKTFDQTKWNYHSVLLPKEMSKQYRDEIHVVDYQRFFWPMWDDAGIRKMFLEKTYNFSSNYAVHLWETASKKNFLDFLTPTLIATADTGIFCELRKIFFGPETKIPPNECQYHVGNSHPDSLLGHWSFDHPDGPKIPDLSGNHLNGVSLGPVMPSYESGVGVRHGKVLYLAGNGAHPFLPIPPGITFADFTICWWMFLTEESVHEKDVLSIVTAENMIVVETNMITVPKRHIAKDDSDKKDVKATPAANLSTNDDPDFALVMDDSETDNETEDQGFLQPFQERNQQKQVNRNVITPTTDTESVMYETAETPQRRRKRPKTLDAADTVNLIELAVSMSGNDYPRVAHPMKNWIGNREKYSLQPYRWHHVALTMSKVEGRIRLYIDGMKAVETNWYSHAEIKGIWLGTRQIPNLREQWNTEKDFRGKFDTVMAFATSLHLPTIQTLSDLNNRYRYGPSISKSMKDMVTVMKQAQILMSRGSRTILWYDANSADRESIYDRTGNGLHGKPVKTVQTSTDSGKSGILLKGGDASVMVLQTSKQVYDLPFFLFNEFTVAWFGRLEDFNSTAFQSSPTQDLLTMHFHSDRKAILQVTRLSDQLAEGHAGEAFLEPRLIILDGIDREEWSPLYNPQHCRFLEGHVQHFVISYNHPAKSIEWFCNGVLALHVSFKFLIWMEEVTLGPTPIYNSYVLRDFKMFNYALNRFQVRQLFEGSSFPIEPFGVSLLQGNGKIKHIVENGVPMNPFKPHAFSQDRSALAKSIAADTKKSIVASASQEGKELLPLSLTSTAFLDDLAPQTVVGTEASIIPLGDDAFEIAYLAPIRGMTPIVEVSNSLILFQMNVTADPPVIDADSESVRVRVSISYSCGKGGEAWVIVTIPEFVSSFQWKKVCPQHRSNLWEIESLEHAVNPPPVVTESSSLTLFTMSVWGLCSLATVIRVIQTIQKCATYRTFPKHFVIRTILILFLISILLRCSTFRVSHKNIQYPKPFITVIMPCYNQAHYLKEAVDSVVFQTYDHWELIIVDDGSPDSCSATGEELAILNGHKRIRVIRKKNGGLSSARNFGISRAMGNWILCLDADDYITPTYMSRVAEVITANHGNIHFVYSNQQFYGESLWKWDIPQYEHKRLLHEGIFPVQTVFQRADWANAGGFNEVLPWGNEDWSFWISVSSLGGRKAVKLPEYLVYYRYKRQSMQREQLKHEELVPMMRTLHPFVYEAQELLEYHNVILRSMSQKTVRELVKKIRKFPSKPQPYMWLGMYFERKNELDMAAKLYSFSLEKYRLLVGNTTSLPVKPWFTAGMADTTSTVPALIFGRGKEDDMVNEDNIGTIGTETTAGQSFTRFIKPRLPEKLDWQPLWRLGVVYAKLGRDPEAKETCRAAVDIREDLRNFARQCYALTVISEKDAEATNAHS